MKTVATKTTITHRLGNTVSNAPLRRLTSLAALGALTLTAAACGPAHNAPSPADAGADTDTDAGADTAAGAGAELSGSIAGSGASSQENAALAWIAGFTEHTGVTVNYDPTGSGTGREQFLSGTVHFAGTDSVLTQEELDAATDRCSGGEAIELPLYISPIAIVYNLETDAEHLNLTGEVLAKIFTGEITTWNDPQIAEANPGIDLPEQEIIPVNRSDKSGTTANFTSYLSAVAPEVWTHGEVEEWPISGTQSGQQTSGMIDVVASAPGAIGYADASRAGDLGTAAIGVGEEFVPYSAQAAATVVDVSPPAEGASEARLRIDLARDTDAAGAYPIVLISYLVACSAYDDAADAANVAAYLAYVASEEGQQRASQPDVAGSAPISADLRGKALAAIETISAG